MALAPQLLPCDGCGQLADPLHIARRLQRLEWATRYRPVHIQALLVSGIAPTGDHEYLYNPDGTFAGEAGRVLSAVQIASQGKNVDAVLSEFQKLGLMLIQVLECPLSDGSSASEARSLLEKQLAPTVTRIRRSLKPKRIILISPDLVPVADRLRHAELGCPVFPPAGVFLSGMAPASDDLQAFRSVLGAAHAQPA